MGDRAVGQRSFARLGRLGAALAATALTLCPTLVGAWGFFGHETTARIALANVRPGTRAAIARLIAHERELGTPDCRIRSLEEAATWPDCVRREGWRWGYTAAWHYQTEPISEPYDFRKNCSGGNCVSAQVERNQRILADESLPANVRLEALAFMVHFVGDIHMPLHSGDNDDRGGNAVTTSYGIVPDLNLHRVWDGALAERAITSARPPLVRRYDAAERASLGVEARRTGVGKAMRLRGTSSTPTPSVRNPHRTGPPSIRRLSRRRCRWRSGASRRLAFALRNTSTRRSRPVRCRNRRPAVE